MLINWTRPYYRSFLIDSKLACWNCADIRYRGLMLYYYGGRVPVRELLYKLGHICILSMICALCVCACKIAARYWRADQYLPFWLAFSRRHSITAHLPMMIKTTTTKSTCWIIVRIKIQFQKVAATPFTPYNTSFIIFSKSYCVYYFRTLNTHTHKSSGNCCLCYQSQSRWAPATPTVCPPVNAKTWPLMIHVAKIYFLCLVW